MVAWRGVVDGTASSVMWLGVAWWMAQSSATWHGGQCGEISVAVCVRERERDALGGERKSK